MAQVKVKTIADALAYTGRTLADLEVFKGLSRADDAKHQEADFRLKVWIEALNKQENDGKDWKPDFSDGTIKYGLYAWIRNKPNGGVGFVVTDAIYYCSHTYTDVGSRHVCKSESVYDQVVKIAKTEIETVWTE